VQQDGGGTAVVSDGDNWVQGKTNASDWYATLTDDMRAHRHVRLTTVGVRFRRCPGIRTSWVERL
jgi:hypothetical protein